MRPKSKCALVVGASSGIGAACAERLAREGYHLALLARRKGELTKVCEKISSEERKALPFVHDVMNTKEIPQLFDKIITELGGLDLVIYAAGVMPAVASDEYNIEKDRQIIEVNLMGAIAWLNEVAMFFSRVKNGTIVGISSVAGDRGRKGNPAYCTSKAALNTFLESLRNRLEPFSVHVLTIKPGFVDTVMTRGKEGLFWLISADEAARQIIEAINKEKTTVYVPKRWWLVGTIIKFIPSYFFRKLNI